VIWLGLWCATTIANLVYWGLPSSVSGIVFFALNALVALAVAYIVVGIGGGFVREFVRGYRESSGSSTRVSG
jgi:hypothetical protein